MLSEKCLTDFKAIYFKEFGVHLSDQETLEKAIKLLRLFQIITKPINTQVLSTLGKGGEEHGRKI